MRSLAAWVIGAGIAVLCLVSFVDLPGLAQLFGLPQLDETRLAGAILLAMSAIGAVAWLMRKR